MAHYIATERLYLDKDGKVVKADDPTRASLLIGEGGRLPIERAEELGLTGDMTLEENPREKAISAAENKAVAGPSATKAAAAKAEELGLTGDMTLEENPREKAISAAENKAVAGPSATKAAAAKAEELGVNIADVEGSGKGGNITVADIEAVAAPPAPKEEAPKAPAKGRK
jgi:pyruvate/2-oxoglutarate dehydrogenase complex dihydrolipoamide acyltransferase (E2) component